MLKNSFFMDASNVLFWNVDTQVDFVEPHGKLYVPGAEELKPLWAELTQLAADRNIQVINTADFHYPDAVELSANPNFVTTFPEHCMANTEGAAFVAETRPENPEVYDWYKEYLNQDELKLSRNIVIRKDAFDVFAGNPLADTLVKMISPKNVIVYGVTTNVCVNDAVVGLAGRVENVYVLMDAIKELPNIPLPFENWKKLGVKMIELADLDL